MKTVTDRHITITARGITAGGRTYNTEQTNEGVSMLTTEETTRHTTTTGTFDAASRLCTAWQWLERQRQTAPEGADVWDIRWRAQQSTTYLSDLLHTLQAGEYRLSPLQLHGQGDERKAVWGAQDALVLKWVALSIEGQLPLHPACEHVKGHGGGRQSVSRLHGLLTDNPDSPPEQAPKKTAGYAWVCRTDIRGYYRNINKATLLNQVSQHVQDPVLVELIRQYIHYTVEDGGTFHTPEKGISRGCPLSPLMGALHLYDMDEHFSQQRHIHYARYMDDIIILAATRWQLRKQTKRLMQWFSEYGFEAHPDKTQIGRTAKGFDWMGAWLTHEGVTDIAPRAKANHREKVRRLYERLARVPHWLRHRRQQRVHARVSAYRKRWNIWARALLGRVVTLTTLCVCAAWSSAYASIGLTSVTLSGLPTTVPSDARAGDELMPVTLSMLATTSGASDTAGSWTYTGWTNNSLIYSYALGKYYALSVFPGCSSIVFKPSTMSAPWIKKGAVTFNNQVSGTNGAGTSVTPSAAGSVVITGHWVLTDDVSGPNYNCTDLTPTSQSMYLALSNKEEAGGYVGLNNNVNVQARYQWPQGSQPAPTVRPTCEFTNTAPLSGNFGSQALSPTTINKTAHGKIIAAGSPDYFPISISCTGNMTGVQPMLEIKWTRSVAWGGGSQVRFGTRSETPSDATNGVVLLSSKGVVGGNGPCQPQPKGKDLCSFYNINPGTPLNLYPTLFRNTNTTDKVQSGLHTVTGTIDLVMP